MTEDERYALGLQKRREVLGDAHVDRAIAAQTPETAEFVALITRYAWGEIWTRPGLDAQTRRLLVLAMTIALGRDEELRAALRVGVARDPIVETILQSAIYCGVPAANHAFALARTIFAETDSA